MSTVKGNVLIGQSGGPTSVINASLAAVVKRAMRNPDMKNILGMRWGIEGFMNREVVDLGNQPGDVIENLHLTPSSALGSCRYKLQDEDLPKVFELLKEMDIKYIFLIGGNDTMDTIQRIEAFCQNRGYNIRGIGIPKTVDNDLYGTDHTPGYGSAARYVALSTLEAGILARDMRRVDQFAVHQTVGREAGWLAASSALAKTTPDSAPHIILLPEVPINKHNLIENVRRVYEANGYVYIVCGEGVTYDDGKPISASSKTDNFANLEFGAMGGGSAAVSLHKLISEEFGWRGEFQITESLPMCGADRASPIDLEEAAMCGDRAVALAEEGKTGLMVSMVRKPGTSYEIEYATAALADVAVRAKPMPGAMISKDGMYVTDAYVEYAKPLIGELPSFVHLDMNRAFQAKTQKAV